MAKIWPISSWLFFSQTTPKNASKYSILDFKLSPWSLNVVCFLLGDSPAFEFYMPMCSETSAYKIQMPGNHPKESIQNTIFFNTKLLGEHVSIKQLYRIPKSVIKRDLEDTSVEIWQREWDTTNKGRITKDYFPKLAERLHAKIHLTQNFTTMITGHGKLKAYLYRFKIIEAPNCPCGNDSKQRNTYYSNAKY